METLCRVAAMLLLIVWSISAHAESAPMRYLVFDWNAAGEPVLVFERRVQLKEARSSVAMADGQPAEVALRLGTQGENSEEVAVARAMHAPADASGNYLAHDQLPSMQPFVVRTKLDDETSFSLQHAGKTFHYTLGKTRPTKQLDALFDAAQLSKASTPANRVDILVIGEGYTAAEQTRFQADVAAFEQKFFSVSPYREYKSFVALNALFVPSLQSGADHPRYSASCSGGGPTCCADAVAEDDPVAGRQVNTAFDGTYCAANIYRLLTVDYRKVLVAAAAAPDWDFVFVLVNDAAYGGSGGYIPVSSTGRNSDAIVVHEYGHSFTGLADEYETEYPGFPACSDLGVVGVSACETNVTDELRRHKIKWRHFIDAQTPIPSPPGSAGIGLFEGARYRSDDIYRPAHDQCLMGSVTPQFCAVCKEAYVLRLYGGGWGAPAAGISLIEPGSESPSTTTVIDFATASDRVLQATLLRPEHALEVFWRVNGKRVEGINEPRLDLNTLSLQPGLNRVELRVVDPNTDVRTAKGGALAQQRVWQVSAGTGGTLVNPMGLTGLWYEPATSGQGANLQFIDERRFILTFYGFERDGDRLWLVGDFAGEIAYGAPLHFDLIEARGGVFENLNPGAITRPVWGSGQLRFVDCDHAEFRMIGNDGTQELELIKLVGVARLSCNVL